MALEVGLNCFREDRIGVGGVGEEGQGGAELEVVGGTEDLADRFGGLVRNGEKELGALEEAAAEVFRVDLAGVCADGTTKRSTFNPAATSMLTNASMLKRSILPRTRSEMRG